MEKKCLFLVRFPPFVFLYLSLNVFCVWDQIYTSDRFWFLYPFYFYVSSVSLIIVGKHAISLSNESQYLLVSETSLLEIFKQFKRDKNTIQFDELAESFRANFIVNGDSPFEEDDWREVEIGKFHFKVSMSMPNCCESIQILYY